MSKAPLKTQKSGFDDYDFFVVLVHNWKEVLDRPINRQTDGQTDRQTKVICLH